MNYVAVGIFVIAMLAALVGVVSMMMGRTGASDDYHLVLDNVADVKFGTQVRYEGYPIGQVEKIEPFAEGNRMRFRIDVTVRKGWRVQTDSTARIGSSSFLAAKTIDIDRGESATVIEPGGRIASAPPVDMFSVMAKVAGELSDLSRESVKPLLDDLGSLAKRFGGNLETETTKLLRSLNVISGEVERRAGTISATLETVARQLSDSGKNLNAMLSKENAAAVKQVLSDVQTTTRTFASTSRQLDTTLGQVNGLIKKVDQLVARNSGNVDRSLTDVRYTLRAIAQSIDGIMHNIDGSSRNLSEFSRLIRQNPGLLLGGSPREQVSPAGGRFRN